ncbi:PLP-dependent transferase [Trametes elegans]|nr:PLP-dependent transferase [Trametes elegans]
MSAPNPSSTPSGAQSNGAYADTVSPDLHQMVSAWFLGPQAENLDMLKNLFAQAADMHQKSRLAYYPEDGAFITEAIRESAAFKIASKDIQDIFTRVTALLYKYSIPFFSQRYAGHMSFEMSLPSILGWVTTVLCNPNNVAFEASPLTTLIELEVGEQLCRMLGYTEEDDKGKPLYWGHIACDGTVANLESVWFVFLASTRNLKYYPLSLRDAMKPGGDLHFIASTFTVPLPTTGRDVLLSELGLWQLLNLPSKTILDIPERLHQQYGITSKYLDDVLYHYIVQTRGKQAVETEWQMPHSPTYFIAATKHYSWPKSAAIAGLGAEYMHDVPVDEHARIDIQELRKNLDDCLAHKKPVFAVVAIIGSTEEGSVDPLDKILDLRDEYESKGLCFLVHADAAWGGYFASMIRKERPAKGPYHSFPDEPPREFVPSVTLRQSTVDQFHALARTDSITIDPHKAGYIPYPAGGLCYRDGRLKSLLTWSAPYIVQGASGESIGIYGVEGSKPGAPAVATYMHHEIVGLYEKGHGALLGEASWSCRRISAHWGAMSTEADQFIVVPFNPLPAEADGPDALEQQKQFIRTRILGMQNDVIIQDTKARDLLFQLGSDLNINAFACNFRLFDKGTGKYVVNQDVEEANYLNNSIFHRLSITAPGVLPETIPMFLSSTTFAYKDYRDCVQHYKKRMGLETESRQDLFLLRNVVMSPFQTAGNFVQKLADTFQKVLVEEMEHVVARNTITPQTHSFILQGVDGNGRAYLTYCPYFYNANSRFQVILSVALEDVLGGATNILPCYLNTEEDTTVDNVCRDGAAFGASVVQHADDMFPSDGKGNVMVGRVKVSDVKVIKMRRLDSRYRELAFPKVFVPLYLYGSGDTYFIDHMLVRAPNAQLSAQVKIRFDTLPPAGTVEKGALLAVDRSEAAMQPVDDASVAWFKEGAELAFQLYDDPHPVDAAGPGLLPRVGSVRPLATGTLTLGKPFVDITRLNKQDFTEHPRASHRMVSFTSREAHPDTKLEWRNALNSAFEK